MSRQYVETRRGIRHPTLTSPPSPRHPAACGVFCVHRFCGWVGRASMPHGGPKSVRHVPNGGRGIPTYQPTPKTPPRASIPRPVFAPRARPGQPPHPRLAWEASPRPHGRLRASPPGVPRCTPPGGALRPWPGNMPPHPGSPPGIAGQNRPFAGVKPPPASPPLVMVCVCGILFF